MTSGQSLVPDTRVPQPYHDLVKTGLSLRERGRTVHLRDIRYVLRSDLKVPRRSSVSQTPAFPPAAAPVPARSACGHRLYPDLQEVQRGGQDVVDGTEPPQYSSLGMETKDLLYYEMDHVSRLSSSASSCVPRCPRTLSSASPSDRSFAEAEWAVPSRSSRFTEHRGADGCVETHPNAVATTQRKPHMDQKLRGEEYPESREGVGSQAAASQPPGERMKVYNVRYGVEFDLEPDSGLVLESATEQTASEGEESRPESTESNSRSPGFVITDEAELDEGFERTGGHILDSSVLCNEYLIMSQLQDSATLLEEAQSSMERLEEHIISGIKTLQHFTEYGDFGLSLQATADPQIENDSHVVPAGGIETDQEVGNGDVSPVLEAEIDSQFGSSKDWTSTSSSEVHFQVRGSKDASGFMASVGGQDVDTCSVAKVTEEGESKAAGMDVPSDLHREIALRDRARLLSAPLSYGFCSVVEPPVTNRPPVNRRKAGIGPTIRCITSATKGLHHSQSARTLPTNGNKADLSESVKRRATSLI
ncbi:inactive serine/threonine-protein kinase TEX14 isoform X2 [Latimeria chalumnae]|uniref:inactive serine/threonine-protein kinase TEX14 isoform X2 n=1 Tax=Latimeria chalumnae TaxID=7897 RepID=UPI00313DE821